MLILKQFYGYIGLIESFKLLVIFEAFLDRSLSKLRSAVVAWSLKNP